jgi:protocatechuate 3,4-dioxygenase beta subunit
MALSFSSSAPVIALMAALLATGPAAAGEIRGRVLIENKPAPGVTVSIVPFEDGFAVARREARREDLPAPLVSGTTRPDGSFALVVPATLSKDAAAVVSLALSGGGLAPFRLGRLLDPAGEDVGDVRLGRSTAIAGRVVDANGGPLVGATVTLWAGRGRMLDELSAAEALPQTATTNPDGRFRFEVAGAEGNRLRFEAPGFATQERIQVRSGALLKPAVLALGRVVRGKVTLADKRTPPAVALVRFEGRTSTRWVETRPDGSFLIDSAPLQAGSLVADARDSGRAAAPVAAGAAEPVAIVLAPTGGLRGRVVESDSVRPVPGVRLVARGEGTVFLARSGRDGAYQIRGLSPRRYRLEADDERFVPWSREVLVVAGQLEDQDVPLVRGATLAGRVIGEDGAPIDGAVLSLTRAGENPFRAVMRRMQNDGQVRSARDGSFKATRLMPGDNQRLDVRHDEFEERSIGGVDLAPGALRSGMNIVLRRGLVARGIVRDENALPLAGVEVVLSRSLAFTARSGRYGQSSFSFVGPGSMARRETGADGRFEFRGLKSGDYTLSAGRQGFARAVQDPVKIAEGHTGEPIELVLRPGVSISGVVRDRAGAPSAGWLVLARASGENSAVFGPASLRTQEPTGEDGAFVIEGLAEGGSYDLQLMASGGLGPRRSGVNAPAEGVEITVGGNGQIRGQVLDAESGRPVTDFEVTYLPDARGGGRFSFSNASRGRGMGQPQSVHAEDGAFVLDDVPAGQWTVQAGAAGYQKGSAAAVSVEDGGTAEGVELRLSKGGVVSGRVLDSRTGRPVLDATVSAVLSGGGQGVPMRMAMAGSSENEATTDADGRYEVAGLAPGIWTLTASHPDWSDATTNVEIKDAPAVADIRLGQGGSIGGVVTAGGRPVPGAQVGLSPAGEGGFGRGPFGSDQGSLTDEGGRFRFDRLQPGRYTVGASLRNQSSAPVEAVITAEEAQDVTLTLAEGAVIRGTVSGLADTARAGVEVSASGPEQYFANTRTAADGGFELADVPEGTIQVMARTGDFMAGSRVAVATVTLAPGQREATTEIVFEQGYRVEGHVTRAGRPVPDVMVLAAPDGGGRGGAASQTDEAGAFVLDGLKEGDYTIVATAGRQPIRRKVTISGDTTVDLDAPPARIAGMVVESGSGRPLGDVTVQVDDQGGPMHFMASATSDSSGRFDVEDLEPKEYRLSFQKPAYQAETRQATATEEPGELRVELRRGEGIALQARDGVFGVPLRGLMVRVLDGAGAPVFTGSVSLDSEGRGEVPALRPGSYELRADSSGYAAVRIPNVSAPSPTIPLTLTPGGTIEIQVGPATLALPTPEGVLIGADDRPCLWNIFTDDGKVSLRGPSRSIENVPPGRYTFQVAGGDRREVTVVEGGHAVVSLP